MSGTDLSRLLLALQFTDSSFPSGMYTLSHGLEGLAQRGEVDARRLPEVLHSMLRHAIGPADSVALALAWAATREHGGRDTDALLDAVTRIDRRLHATRLTRELRDGATRTGKQVLDLAAELLDDPVVSAWNAHVRARRSPGSQSVVMGVVYARGGLDQRA